MSVPHGQGPGGPPVRWAGRGGRGLLTNHRNALKWEVVLCAVRQRGRGCCFLLPAASAALAASLPRRGCLGGGVGLEIGVRDGLRFFRLADKVGFRRGVGVVHRFCGYVGGGVVAVHFQNVGAIKSGFRVVFRRSRPFAPFGAVAAPNVNSRQSVDFGGLQSHFKALFKTPQVLEFVTAIQRDGLICRHVFMCAAGGIGYGLQVR